MRADVFAGNVSLARGVRAERSHGVHGSAPVLPLAPTRTRTPKGAKGKPTMTRTTLVLTSVAAPLVGLALAQGPRFAEATLARQGAALGTHAATQTRTHVQAPQGAAAHRFAGRAAQARHRFQGEQGLQDALDGVVAAALSLSPDELMAAKTEGASVAQIAEGAGIPLADVEAAYLAARADAIVALLAEGTIDDVQAAQMTDRGPAAFAALAAREGCDGGQNATGTPLHRYREAAPRGPAAALRCGPGSRW